MLIIIIILIEIKVPTKIPTTTTTTTSTTEISYTYTAVGAIEGTTIEKIVEIKRKFIQSPTTLGKICY